MVSTVAPDPAEEMRTFLYMILAVLIVLMVGVTKLVEKGQRWDNVSYSPFALMDALYVTQRSKGTSSSALEQRSDQP